MGQSSNWIKSVGLKQAPRAWFERFASVVTAAGFAPSDHDSALFVHTSPRGRTLLLLYVDGQLRRLRVIHSSVFVMTNSPVFLLKIDSLRMCFCDLTYILRDPQIGRAHV